VIWLGSSGLDARDVTRVRCFETLRSPHATAGTGAALTS
jgi:hypothetical protein